jgi:hypothetical protein
MENWQLQGGKTNNKYSFYLFIADKSRQVNHSGKA